MKVATLTLAAAAATTNFFFSHQPSFYRLPDNLVDGLRKLAPLLKTKGQGHGNEGRDAQPVKAGRAAGHRGLSFPPKKVFIFV